jgi:hypothetical protein
LKIIGTLTATAATVASAGALGISSAPIASADEAGGSSNQNLGSPAKVVSGSNVQAWTVSNLKQSSDIIPYPVSGTLWEATATDEAVQGEATPIVPSLGAISPSGQTYQVLYQVATPQGINPSTLAQGQKTSGKVYFDVTGDNPNTVVYRDLGGQKQASWVQSTTSQPGTGRQAVPAGIGGQTAPTPAGNPAQPAGNPAEPAGNPAEPAGNPAESAPLPLGNPTAPDAGRQGTPIPGGSHGTPSPAGSAVSPAGNLAAPAPAAGNPEAPTAAAGNPEAPAPANNLAVPAPAADNPEAPTAAAGNPTPPGNGMPAPAGSQGTSPGALTP